MKKTIFLYIGVMGLVFSSCIFEDLPKDPVVAKFTAPVLTVPVTSFTPTESQASQSLGSFVWTAADFGFQAATSYDLQIDKAGNKFASPMTLATTTKLSSSFTIGDFNTKLLLLEIPAAWESNIEARVVATVNDKVQKIISPSVVIKVKPYEVVIDYPKLYVPGSYQGWKADDVKTVIYSVKNDGKYERYFWWPDATTEFKLLKVPAWEEANTIGDPVSGGQSGTLQIGGWGGNNAKITGGPGYFWLKTDLIAKTYSATKTDWGLIGSATPGGWSSDQNMTYDATKGVWKITLALVAGDIKFRANDAWDINYGDNGPDGKLELNGANIAVSAAGNYTVTLNLEVPKYTYSVLKN
jgi:hypothetical protein